ncbi:purine catabolism regulatory protein [Streptomyces zhaozhouensis]|uniref:Purine catabolism regulatory protein n=1 Tax=Streptomyces zhaozhouensis TaxID=1300267 RepID=A0A286E157_9ACTN|nr:PucR family transcriptional regulator [Streptomyces zhaozhouensis]SOD64636.1 purine catabolism regulatory protein [Streptomyces zhaozhouensis]
MRPTLAALVHHSALRLRVLAGEDRLDTEVRWAHTSELPDPTPYLDGGELLLTIGLKLSVDDAGEMRRYVERLAGAGVVGLGFGIGVNHPAVTPELLDAVREVGLPLLEVPRPTPFIAISKAVSAAIAAEQYRTVTAGFAAQRELTRAALAPDGPEALLTRLSTQVNGWTALYDRAGAVTAVAPGWAARRAGLLADEVRRLGDRPAPASTVCAAPEEERDGGDRVELQLVGTGQRGRAVLAIGTEAPLGDSGRYAVQAAVALLTLVTERSGAYQQAESRLGGAVLRMLLSGEPDHARAVAGQLYGGLLDAPLRVLAAEADEPERLVAFGQRLEAAAARAGEAVLAAPDGEGFVLLLADGGGTQDACAKHAEASEGVVLGLSAPTGLAHAAAAYQQAREALLVARRRGRALVEHDDVATGSLLPLLGDEAVRAFADGMLRALRDHDRSGRGDLLASLRAWLSRHGQWDAAAAELGVHRHTLRYRMRRVEEILDRSLDDPDLRMELWLALKASGLAAPPGPRHRPGA